MKKCLATDSNSIFTESCFVHTLKKAASDIAPALPSPLWSVNIKSDKFEAAITRLLLKCK